MKKVEHVVFNLILVSLAFAIGNTSFAHAGSEIGYFDQRLNPADPSDQRTFRQKFIINSDYASGPDAPVLYFVGGEVALVTEYAEKSFSNEIMKRFHAHFVGLEHRYYGESQPFDRLTNENMQYLSIENALSDLVQFQKHITKERGFTGKWFALGGSYPGGLAAFYRQKHPDLVVGALASSALVHFLPTETDWDRLNAITLGKDCVRKYRKTVLSPIEAAVHDPSSMATYKTLFKADDLDDVDFLIYIGFNATFFPQMMGSEVFCKLFDQLQPMEATANAFNQFNSWFQVQPKDTSPKGLSDDRASSYSVGLGMRQWAYQSCAEIGGFDVPNSNPDESLQSQIVKEQQDWEYQCQIFGVTQAPKVEETNRKYYEPLLDPSTSNILFTTGLGDPTRFAGISKEFGNDTNPNTIAYSIPGAPHCADVAQPRDTDPQPLKDAREFELTVIGSWLGIKP